ncbi:hypothetical protein SEA_JUSTBECAUSE_331 [Streptomyces phage JustBecause]|jgi:hypothetical protein|nr:hypothetical protein SEA_JUSTBECAUSE_331 [Streptomyces phage JustBecause]
MGETVKLNAKVTTWRDGKVLRDARWEAYAAVLKDGKPFETSGHLSGRPGSAGSRPSEVGRLAREWHAEAARSTYVVFSYETPIAWRNADGTWTIPARGTLGFDAESQTTVTGMNKIRTAVASFSTYRETPQD